MQSPPSGPVLPEPAQVTITPYPDTSKWDWPEESQKEWREVVGEGEGYVAFCNRWYDPAARSNFHNKFPYELSLGMGWAISPAGKPILVTEAYDKMFHRLLRLREDDRVGRTVKGAVVTGQPGIGAPLTKSPPHDNLSMDLFSRKNYLPKVHARTADFNLRSRTLL